MTRREPYEWQEQDILGFLDHDLTGLNASQPGAGKTVVSVEVAHRAGTDVNLIIAPDSTHATAWGPTVLGQTDQELRVVGNKNKATQSALFDLEFGHPGWYALTPQLFTRMDISQLYPDLLIVDEALALQTPVLTTRGWTTIGGLAVGDWVYGASGDPTRVERLYPIRYDALTYEFELDSGETLVSDAGHKWLARPQTGTTYLKPRVVTTQEMVDRGCRWAIDGCPVLSAPDSALPVDPFRLRDTHRGKRTTTGTLHRVNNIRPVPSVPVRCIQVSAKDHLFLVGRSLVPTHNCHQLSKPMSKGQRKLSGYAPKRDKPISKQVGAVMALSGTPFRNDFQRAWSVTRLLWPELSGFGQIADAQHDRWCRYRMNSEYDNFSYSKIKYTTERNPGQLFSEMPYVVQHLAREQCCAFHPTGFLSLEKPNEIVYEVPLLPSQVKVIKDLEKMSMAWLEDNPLIADLPIVMAGRIRQAVIGEMRIDNDGNVAYADNAKSPIIDTAIEIAHEHDGEPVVVFTASQKAAELATVKFIKAGFSAVEVSGDYRTTRVEDLAGFGTKYQIAVCVIAAVGTGTDGLQRHSNVEIWLDRDLDSTNNIQAESRLDRIGATKQVQRYILRDQTGYAEKRYTRETMIRTSIEQSTRRRT